MSGSAAMQRIAIENSLQVEPDGSFLVRPFSIFGAVYELPNHAARDRYISGKIIHRKIVTTMWLSIIIALPIITIFILRISRFSCQ